MKLSELLAAVPLHARYDCRAGDPEITVITDDSRKAQPGSLFVAVRGEHTDGHRFVDAALAAGAAAAVCEGAAEPRDGVRGKPIMRVEDSARWLAVAAAAWHGLDRIQQRGELPVVAVTGTNGKTTTTYLVQSMLAAAGRPTAIIGTVAYDLVGRQVPAPWTTPPPLTLAEMLVEAHGHGARAAAIEASSHSLVQRRIDGLRCNAAIFTNLTGDHLDYHRTMEAYLAAKKRLFDLLDRDATAVVNADDPAAEAMLRDCRARIIRFETLARQAAETQSIRHERLVGEIVKMTAAGSEVRVRFGEASADLTTPLLGRHNVQNVLAAVGAGLGLGLDLQTACAGAAALPRVRGRLEPVETDDRSFAVVVDYAHTDDALRNVLTALRPLTSGRLVCVFGCGGDRDRAKRPRMARVAAELADRVIVTSDNPRTEDPEAIIAEIQTGFAAADLSRSTCVIDRGRAIETAVAEADRGDTVLIAGKGHEDYQILGTLRIHFDDVEAAQAALRRCGPGGRNDPMAVAG